MHHILSFIIWIQIGKACLKMDVCSGKRVWELQVFEFSTVEE